MKLTWALICELEHATAAHDRAFAKRLPFKDLIVLREVCCLFEEANWNPNCEKGMQYIRALFPGFTHSVHLELGFNDLRDNETRGARHKQRGETLLQAFRT
jgi:hypothetical protein